MPINYDLPDLGDIEGRNRQIVNFSTPVTKGLAATLPETIGVNEVNTLGRDKLYFINLPPWAYSSDASPAYYRRVLKLTKEPPIPMVANFMIYPSYRDELVKLRLTQLIDLADTWVDEINEHLDDITPIFEAEPIGTFAYYFLLQKVNFATLFRDDLITARDSDWPAKLSTLPASPTYTESNNVFSVKSNVYTGVNLSSIYDYGWLNPYRLPVVGSSNSPIRTFNPRNGTVLAAGASGQDDTIFYREMAGSFTINNSSDETAYTTNSLTTKSFKLEGKEDEVEAEVPSSVLYLYSAPRIPYYETSRSYIKDDMYRADASNPHMIEHLDKRFYMFRDVGSPIFPEPAYTNPPVFSSVLTDAIKGIPFQPASNLITRTRHVYRTYLDRVSNFFTSNVGKDLNLFNLTLRIPANRLPTITFNDYLVWFVGSHAMTLQVFYSDCFTPICLPLKKFPNVLDFGDLLDYPITMNGHGVNVDSTLSTTYCNALNAQKGYGSTGIPPQAAYDIECKVYDFPTLISPQMSEL
jgi:hypothetical protein